MIYHKILISFLLMLFAISPLFGKNNNQILNKVLDEKILLETRMNLLDSLEWEALELTSESIIESLNTIIPWVKQPLRKLDLLGRRAHLYRVVGDKNESIKLYDEAILYAQKVGNSDFENKFKLSLVQQYTIDGKLEKAEGILNLMLKNGIKSKRVEAIVYLCLADVSNVRGDFIKAKSYSSKAKEIHSQTGFDLGVGEAYQYLSMVSLNLGEFDSTIYYANKMYEVFSKKDYIKQIAIAYYYMALGYKGNYEIEKCLSFLDSAKTIFKKVENYGGGISCLDKMATILEETGQLERAKEYYIEALNLQKENKDIVFELIARYTSLAQCYLSLKEYDNCKNTLDDALDLIRNEKEIGQLSYLHLLYGEYYLAKDKLSKAEDEFILAQNSIGKEVNSRNHSKIYFGLATVAFRSKAYTKSIEYLDIANNIGDDLSMNKDIQWMYFQNYKSLGNSEKSLIAIEKYQLYKDSLQEIKQNNIVQETLAKYQVERALDKEKLAESEKAVAVSELKVQRTMKWFGFALFGSALLFFYLIFNRSKKLRLEREKSTKLKLDVARNTINHSKDILKNQSHLILEKNRIIKELKENLERFFDVEVGVKEEFMTLLEKRILTKDDWMDFKKSFFLIYPDFVNNVEKKYPNISEAELRVMCLTKLGLQKDEMADMLGVLPKSVQRTISRFKTKFEIENDLEELCESF